MERRGLGEHLLDRLPGPAEEGHEPREDNLPLDGHLRPPGLPGQQHLPRRHKQQVVLLPFPCHLACSRSKVVEGSRLMAINFHAIYNNETMVQIMKKWEKAVFEYSQSTNTDPLIRVYCTSEGLVSEEVRRTGALL